MGFKDVHIANPTKFLSTVCELKQQTEIQFFNGDLIATWQHLYFATLNALVAFKNNANISRNVTMEMMLYASAQRQIQKAIEVIGVKPTSTRIAVVVLNDSADPINLVLSEISKCIGKEPTDAILGLTEEKTRNICKAFGISAKELETVAKEGNYQQALVDLVIEHMALLSTQL